MANVLRSGSNCVDHSININLHRTAPQSFELGCLPVVVQLDPRRFRLPYKQYWLNIESCKDHVRTFFMCPVFIVVRVKCNMSANWTDREVFRLIDCWSKEGIQEQLEGSRCNKHVYDKLSRSLAEHDIEKTGEQCRTKVKKLRQEYKKIKDNHNLMGRGRIQWKYFEKWKWHSYCN